MIADGISSAIHTLYTKSWLLDSSYHLTLSLPLSNSLEYSWWIWKWEAKKKKLTNSTSAYPFYFSLFRMVQYLENFSLVEKISYSFILSPCFLFVLNLSVINSHPQHSLSKAAFAHTDLELCNCRKWQLTSLRISTLLTELLILHVCLASQI